jgi:hypothetical protein
MATDKTPKDPLTPLHIQERLDAKIKRIRHLLAEILRDGTLVHRHHLKELALLVRSYNRICLKYRLPIFAFPNMPLSASLRGASPENNPSANPEISDQGEESL